MRNGDDAVVLICAAMMALCLALLGLTAWISTIAGVAFVVPTSFKFISIGEGVLVLLYAVMRISGLWNEGETDAQGHGKTGPRTAP